MRAFADAGGGLAGVRGVILLGGSGTRMAPMTAATGNKHLLPVYDKPLCYYSLSTLIAAGLRQVTAVTSPGSVAAFTRCWGDGHQWGVQLDHVVQPRPDGLASALELAYRASDADWDPQQPTVLILGDNVLLERRRFVRRAVARAVRDAREGYATIFVKRVPDPRAYGVAQIVAGEVVDLEEKPKYPRSSLAVVGLYVYPPGWHHAVATINPSARGEREITDLNRWYLHARKLRYQTLGRSCVWLDAGTPEQLLRAAQAVQASQRPGRVHGSPELEAYRQGWLTEELLWDLTSQHGRTYHSLIWPARR